MGTAKTLIRLCGYLSLRWVQTHFVGFVVVAHLVFFFLLKFSIAVYTDSPHQNIVKHILL